MASAGMTPSAAGWRSPMSQRMFVQGGDAVAAKIWQRWTKRAEELASEHVAAKFGNVTRQFQKAASRADRLQGDITGVLAMSGREASDHEATMRQSQQLLHMSMPQASSALLWPEDFRNLVMVTRRARDQLMMTPGRQAEWLRHGLDSTGSDGEDDAEGLEEEELVETTRSFVHWRRESGSKAPVVLLLGQTEQIPKHVLRDFLSSLNGTCAEEGIPLMVMFGLSLPPQGRMELLEDEPLAVLTLVDAVNLFDVDKICQVWFTELMEDTSTLLTLRPELISNLAKKHMAHSCRSLSQVMTTLALLLLELRMRSYAGFLCNPVPKDVVQLMMQKCDNEANCRNALRVAFGQMIRATMEQSEGHVDHPDSLSEEAQEWFDGSGLLSDEEGSLEAVAEVASEVLMWRTRLAASLAAWDALYLAANPTTKAAEPIWRLSKLINALWPEKATPVQGQEAIEAESKKVSALLHECLSRLASASPEVLQELTQELRNHTPALPRSVQAEVPSLRESVQPPAMRLAIQQWFACVQQRCWQPLTGHARCLFVYGFCTTEPRVRAAWEAVERKLGCSDTHYVDTVLKPLALGSNPKKLDDMALIYRLLECAEGRSVAVSSLWSAFVDALKRMPSDHSPTQAVVAQESISSQTELQTRFGHALLALHTLGVATPYRVNKLGDGGFRDWRLRKRCFGRVCMQSRHASGGPAWDDSKQRPVMDEDDMPLLQLAVDEDATQSELVKTPSPKKSGCIERAVPLNVDDELNYGLKRKRELDAPATAEGKARKVVQKGAKIYMG